MYIYVYIYVCIHMYVYIYVICISHITSHIHGGPSWGHSAIHPQPADEKVQGAQGASSYYEVRGGFDENPWGFKAVDMESDVLYNRCIYTYVYI